MSEPETEPACARCGEPCPKCESAADEERSRARFERFVSGSKASAEAALDPREMRAMLQRNADARAAMFGPRAPESPET